MTLSQNSLTKIKTYVGFGIRSGKVVFGTDNILLSKKVKLVIYDSNLSKNSLDKVAKHAETIGFDLIELDNLAEITHKDNCKIIGLQKGTLTNQILGILKEVDDNNNVSSKEN